jgi:LacI family transcriptional regulator
MITIKEIAQRAGVSPTTVSNVIHKRLGNVSEATYKKVQAILEEERYTPHMGAIMLAHSNSRIIGVITFKQAKIRETVFEDPFTSAILGTCEKAIYESGYSMMLHSTQDVDELLALVSTWKLDGLIIIWAPSSICSRITNSTKKPVVFIDCYFDRDDENLYGVTIDDRKGGFLMAEYLISMGHRDIAFLGMFPDFSGGENARVEGIRQAFALHHESFPDSSCHALSDTQEKREAQYLELYEGGGKTALFFSGDYYAWEALSFYRKRKIDVCEDISIVGFDNSYFSRICCPEISTIHQDIYRKGRAAVELLLKLIANEKPTVNQLCFPVKLMARDSVKRLDRTEPMEGVDHEQEAMVEGEHRIPDIPKKLQGHER